MCAEEELKELLVVHSLLFPEFSGSSSKNINLSKTRKYPYSLA
jgi:hypothetical protein